MRLFFIRVAIALVAGLSALGTAAHAVQDILVHKSPWCGCCARWIDHLEENGFAVRVEEHENMTPIKHEAGVPGELHSCHTAHVEGYVIEGHVPAADIARLLAERPDAQGLAVPGMPAGSPGMEVPGHSEAYQVILFDGTERTVFARH